MKRFRYLVMATVAICALPFASLAAAIGLAALGKCQLDEGSVHPCIIAGLDWGGALYTMGVSGWLGLVTLPVLAGTIAVWLAVELVHWFRTRPSEADR